MTRTNDVRGVAADPGGVKAIWQQRMDSLQYVALVALLAASTLNGFALDWRVLGAEFTIRPDQVVLISLLPVLAWAYVLGRFRVHLTLFDWVVCGFLVSNLASSILFSTTWRASLQGTVLLGIYASMYFVVRQILAGRAEWVSGASNWVLGLGIAQVLYSMLALALYARGYVITGLQRGHLTESSVSIKGTFWEANLLGAYVGVIALFAAVRYLWKPEANGGRTLLFGLFIASLALPLTLTRAAGLAFALGILAILLIGWSFRRDIPGWGKRTSRIVLVLGCVLLLTVTATNGFVSTLSKYPNILVGRWIPASWMPVDKPAEFAWPTGQQARPGVRELILASQSSADGRVDVWLKAIERWRESAILGHGTLAGSAGIKDGWWYSSLFQALYDTGLVGFLLLLGIHLGAVMCPVQTWIRCRRRPMSANLLGFGVGNALLFFTSQFSNFLFVGFPWVFLGLSMGAVDAYSKRHVADGT